MCFNPFRWSLRDLLDLELKTKKSKLQDRAEDISFEEVKESAKEQPKIDQKNELNKSVRQPRKKRLDLWRKAQFQAYYT